MKLEQQQRRQLFSWSASLGVHLCLLAVVGFGSFSSAPRGVERLGGATLLEIGVNEVSASRPSAPVRPEPSLSNKNETTPQVQAQPEPVSPSTAQLGVSGGVASSGALGRTDGQEVNAKNRYVHELRVFIEGLKKYPALARRLQETGTVRVGFRILRDGQIAEVQLVARSSFQRLDEAALQLIQGIGHYKPFPQEMNEEQLPLELPINYGLN